MKKNEVLWMAMGFSLTCLTVTAVLPKERTSIPAVVLTAACTVYLALFIIANTRRSGHGRRNIR
ncbi:MAG: hypothetical protein NC293_12505 [Roseburia sp.]|nr:hypothetical protein [Roseburia sp.]